MTRPLRTLLVANRGEIARRIFATARRMGIATVAVFSDADRDAAHVRDADRAVTIGAAPARDSYLVAEKILDAARRSGADAVHPGYGFLSENPDFAAAVEAAGLIFVGPPAAAIRAMGSKSAAKRLMEAAGVPLVPGWHGETDDPAVLAEAAARIGFPVLIKATAGGGGRGMKVVERPEDFAATLVAARREAASAFGDDRVLVERWLPRPRHVEVQIFADGHGNTVHLHERDCSLQRRHQKVVEEAPAPGLSDAMRAAMGAAAVQAARAVGYVGAGTVEFVTEGESFYFLEMNTRLQVEHPVTEAVTGLDLVEWQLRVARGEPLPLAQGEIPCRGHAVEVRLCAEDPARDFLPQTGRLAHLAFGDGVRVDSAVEAGDEVSRHYDSMIAKLIAHGRDREEAFARLARALAQTRIVGLPTNLDLLGRLLTHADVVANRHDTGTIARDAATLLAPLAPDPRLATVAALALFERETRSARREPTDPFSPWAGGGAWTPNLATRRDITLDDGTAPTTLAFLTARDGTTRRADDGAPLAFRLAADGAFALEDAGERIAGHAVFTADGVAVFADGRSATFREIDPRDAAAAGHGHADRLVAPMPGSIVQVLVEAGATVTEGTPLVVVEAMKMEHVVRAPHDGLVERVDVAVGDVVAEGTELVVMAAEASAAPT